MIPAAAWPVISAGIGALGSYLGRNRGGGGLAARQQMEFQERMSSTAYQRAVKDMRLAGLNPALAYSQGGASTPAGSSIAPEGNELVEGAVSTARMALEARRVKAEIKAIEQQGDAAETNATTQAKQQALRENEFNRDTNWYQVQRELERQQRMKDLEHTSSAIGLLNMEWEGAAADLQQKRFSAEQWKSLQETMGKTFGQGAMRDLANIVVMMLQSRGASSALRLMPGRR